MRDFRQLTVWEKAHGLALEVYRRTARFPKCEVYGLRSQIRKCAASVPANIAEGFGRRSGTERARFIEIAMGSAWELDYFALLSRDLGIIDVASWREIVSRCDELRRMLYSLMRRLLEDPRPRPLR